MLLTLSTVSLNLDIATLTTEELNTFKSEIETALANRTTPEVITPESIPEVEAVPETPVVEPTPETIVPEVVNDSGTQA